MRRLNLFSNRSLRLAFIVFCFSATLLLGGTGPVLPYFIVLVGALVFAHQFGRMLDPSRGRRGADLVWESCVVLPSIVAATAYAFTHASANGGQWALGSMANGLDGIDENWLGYLVAAVVILFTMGLAMSLVWRIMRVRERN